MTGKYNLLVIKCDGSPDVEQRSCNADDVLLSGAPNENIALLNGRCRHILSPKNLSSVRIS